MIDVSTRRWIASGLFALAVAGCGAPTRPNIVLVVIDTAGAEHLGSEVPGLDHTPNLDGLARAGTSFRRAFSPAPWTQPSVASLLTSRMPSTHGVLRLYQVLSPAAVTLAERLAAVGWETAGFVTHDLLRRRLGYAQGFSHWDEQHVAGHVGITSKLVTDGALAWLDARRDGAPFFLFVHYFDPHYVFQHHASHDLTSSYTGELRPAMPIRALLERRERMSAGDITYLVGLYREELAFTDEHVGRLLAALQERNLAERTVVAVVGDHGEEFMRHGWIGHTRTLYDELLRVPFLIRGPGVPAGRSVEAPVSLLDVAPTLSELAGLPPDPEAEGVSLVPLLRGAAPSSRDIHAEVSFVPLVHSRGAMEKTAFKTALIRSDLKLIHDLLTDDFELYDRRLDREEQHDLHAAHPEFAAMREALLAFETKRSQPGGKVLEPSVEEIEQLRALGYVP